MSAVIVDVAAAGSQVPAGGQLALLEAMKMQHVVSATESVAVLRTLVTAGETVLEHQPLVVVVPAVDAIPGGTIGGTDLDAARADLAEVCERWSRSCRAAALPATLRFWGCATW
jgi:hypothetical protein